MAAASTDGSVEQQPSPGADAAGPAAEPQQAVARAGSRLRERFGKRVRLTQEEYDALQQQVKAGADAREQMLRIAADWDNARRRMDQDRQTYVRLANEEMIRRLLPVADDLSRALTDAIAAEAAERLVTGLRMIQKNLEDAMRATGFERIATVGERFDPHRHEAVTQVESSEHPDHTVIEEIRSGFVLNGHVVRPAMVKVAVRPTEEKIQDA